MGCFAGLLNEAIKNASCGRSALVKDLGFGLGVPLAASVIAAILLGAFRDGDWPVSKTLILIDVLKISSIFVLGYHTTSSIDKILGKNSSVSPEYKTAMLTYRLIGGVMKAWSYVLVIHTILLFIRSPSENPHTTTVYDQIFEWVHWMPVVYILLILSFAYMGAFWYANRDLEKKSKDMGVERWANAFVFGANLPSVFAFSLIMLMPLPALLVPSLPHHSYALAYPEEFLAGATALLIYYSTAAAICVDHYAGPFLATREAKACMLAREGAAVSNLLTHPPPASPESPGT